MRDTEINPFDDRIRERLEQFEMPYDPAAWSRFEQKLPQSVPSGLSGIAKFGIGSAVVALLATVAYLWPAQQVEDRLTETVTEQLETTTRETSEPSEPQTDSSEKTSEHSVAEVRPATSNPQESENGQNQSTRVTERLQLSKTDNDLKRNQVAVRDIQTEEPKGREPAEAFEKPASLSDDFHLKMAVSKTKVCVGDEVSFMAISNAGGLQYEWIFGDGERSSRDQTVKTFLNPGTFEIVLSGSKGGTVAQRSETITVYPAPTAIFEMERPIEGIPLYELNTSLQTGERSFWEFSDGRADINLATRQLFRSRGPASVKLTVTTEQGCSSTREQTVRIDEDFKLFAETGFTPNGDGINDLFLPKALEVMDISFEMTVRDAFGREVFRTSDINEPWNGRELNTGVTLPRGSYLWTVVLTEPILRNPVFTGNITIQ